MIMSSIRAPVAQRLWAYQAERFPVFKHGAGVAAFALAGALLPALLNGSLAVFDARAAFVAVAVSFLFFLQLRIADEHKDLFDDRRFRPERPVPRGLVTLAELRWVAAAAVALQVVLVWSLDPRLLALLALVWAWMGLMTVEFFAPKALKARPVLYITSHMVISPLIALFCVACGWVGGDVAVSPAEIGAFLALAFANGVAIEVARKCWAPEDERRGVETYSKLWGPHAAASVAAGAIVVSAALVLLLLYAAGFLRSLAILAAVLAAVAVASTLAYAIAPSAGRAKLIEAGAGVWVLASYALLSAGAVIGSVVQ